MNFNRRRLMDIVMTLSRELKNAANIDARFETIEKMALLHAVAEELNDFEQKLMDDLDVD
jgi:hypothetical protein